MELDGDGHARGRLHAVAHESNTSYSRSSGGDDPAVGRGLFGHVTVMVSSGTSSERTGNFVLGCRECIKEWISLHEKLLVSNATVVVVCGVSSAACGVVHAIRADLGSIAGLDEFVLEGKGDNRGESVLDKHGTRYLRNTAFGISSFFEPETVSSGAVASMVVDTEYDFVYTIVKLTRSNQIFGAAESCFDGGFGAASSRMGLVFIVIGEESSILGVEVVVFCAGFRNAEVVGGWLTSGPDTFGAVALVDVVGVSLEVGFVGLDPGEPTAEESPDSAVFGGCLVARSHAGPHTHAAASRATSLARTHTRGHTATVHTHTALAPRGRGRV